MEPTTKTTSRKKFFLWSAGILTSVTAFKYLFGNKPGKEKKETVKMLTQDGTLVEIDKELLSNYNKKISDNELQQWIKK